MNNDKDVQPEEKREKKPYEQPKLTKYGSVVAFTQAKTNLVSDTASKHLV